VCKEVVQSFWRRVFLSRIAEGQEGWGIMCRVVIINYFMSG
jgi:hypothetical protein